MRANKITLWPAAIGFSLVFVVWLIADRAAKVFVSQFQLGSKITDTIAGIFHITYVQNTGAAFGIFANNPLPLAVVSVLIFVALIFLFARHLYLLKKDKTSYSVLPLHILSLGIVCAGGLSNAIDRLIFGYVIDYIDLDFMSWPVFNIADIGVTVGIVLLIIAMFYNLWKSDKVHAFETKNSRSSETIK